MTKLSQYADLQSLQAAIAASPIFVALQEAPDFAEWCERQGADIDTVVLDWLRSQARQPSALS
jgi:hypothetical protein